MFRILYNIFNSGSGTDALIAARQVGGQGRVYCLDVTDAMLDKQRRNALKLGVDWIMPMRGNAEAIPLPEASVDAVTGNGVFNLVPDTTGVAQTGTGHLLLGAGARRRPAGTAGGGDA
jgi:precorrin-6B methylase 2